MNIMKKSRPPVLSMTDVAMQRLREMLEDAPKGTIGITLGLKNAGCAGVSYVMDFTDKVSSFDEVIESQGIKLIIEPKSLMFLLGTRLDYKTEKMRSGFVFENPNQTDACGCGESVKLVPAEFLDT